MYRYQKQSSTRCNAVISDVAHWCADADFSADSPREKERDKKKEKEKDSGYLIRDNIRVYDSSVCIRVVQSCLVAADAIPRDGEPRVASNELLPAERDTFAFLVLLWMARRLSVFPHIPAHHTRDPSGCVDDCLFSRYAPFLSL